MKTMKKWLISLLCISFCIIFVIGTINFAVDPLMQYRKLNSKITYVAYDYDYINPGVAKNYDYDSVLVGTSLAENTDVDEYEKIFNCKMIKMIYPGGTTLNMKRILDVAFDTHEVKKVIWSIDDNFFFKGSTELSHKLPEYLYDNNKLNDLGYLLNLSVFYNYTFKDVMNTMRGEVTSPLLRGDIWGNTTEFGKEGVLSIYKDEGATYDKGNNFYQANVKANMEDIVLPMVKEHPDTEFVFFFPPKNIIYWKKALDQGLFNAKVFSMRYMADELLKCPNVKVYFYQDNMELTMDFSIYADFIHFNNQTNILLGKMISEGTGELTKENYNDVLDQFNEIMTTIDYSKYIN